MSVTLASSIVLGLAGPSRGGVRTHLSTLASGLPARGWQFRLLDPESPAAVGGPLDLSARADPLRFLRAGRQLTAAVARLRPAVVHAHGVKAGLLLALSGVSAPRVMTIHNVVSKGWGRLLAVSARKALFVAVSVAVRDSLLRSGVPASRCRLVRGGVDLDRFQPVPLPPMPFQVGFVGRLTHEKGIDLFLAAARAGLRGPGGAWTVAGDGPLRRMVEDAAAVGGVKYLGEVQDVVPVLAACHCLAVPSRSEGLGLVALEAMAIGRPVLVADVGGLREIVRDGVCGRLLRPGDAVELARAVASLAVDPACLASWGAAGRDRVRAEFSQETMLDSLAAIYREVSGAGIRP